MLGWIRNKLDAAVEPQQAAAAVDPQHDAADAEMLRASRFFDAGWYSRTYPDVAALGADPALHFLREGAAEGRNPGPDFDTAYYLNDNPDVAASKINPLVHFIRSGEAEGRPGVARDPVEAFEAVVRARRAGRPGIYPQASLPKIHIPARPPVPRAPGAPLPLPPPDLAKRIGSESLEGFELSGREMKQTVVRCLPAGFTFAGSRCLDFGCGVGRMIRHFAAEAGACEFWGTDIDGGAVRWCTENLSPPFRFFQLSETPSLPFESASFDAVFAIGVLSQVYADWQHWAMEIRRILKPDGILVVSYAGQTPFEEMIGLPYGEAEPDFGMFIANPFASWNIGGPMTFISPTWIRTFWGSLFDIDFIAPEAMLDYQSIAVMRKPAPGPARWQDVPLLDLVTSQRFDPDATGKIFAQYDRSRPLRESYGIEARGPATATGWIVFRDDAPAGVAAFVDGVSLEGRFAFVPGAPHRDWNAWVTTFEMHLDFSAIAPGRHALELRFRSHAGKTHALSIPLKVDVAGP